ncbi:hypothetical protein Tco_0374401 [Tanacetum coccineum]
MNLASSSWDIGHNFVSISIAATFIGESNKKNTTSCGIQNFLGYFAETMIEDFDNITFGNVMTMAISEHFFHTKPSVGQRFVFMLRKGTNFSEESVKKSWGKE